MAGKSVRYISIIVVSVVGLATVFVFGLAAGLSGNTDRSWDVLSGSADPFQNRSWSWLMLILAILGYVIVPVIIAIAVTEGLLWYRRSRTQSLTTTQLQIDRQIGDAVAQSRVRAASPAEQARAAAEIAAQAAVAAAQAAESALKAATQAADAETK